MQLARRFLVAVAACLALAVSGCARPRLSAEQIAAYRQAAQRVLPESAKVEVTELPHAFGDPDLIISAHLLEGHSTADASPIVRGDYGTKAALYARVQERSAAVFRSVFSETLLDGIATVKVQTMHGVRYSSVQGGFGGTDRPTILYRVSIPAAEQKRLLWRSIPDQQIGAMWALEFDDLPQIEIVTTPW
jgi:hypothetical protein